MDSKPESSDPSQSSPSTKIASQGPSLTPFNLPQYTSPFIFIPAYAEDSFPTCSAIYLRHPTTRPGYSEIPTPYDADGEVIRLAWEWYSKATKDVGTITVMNVLRIKRCGYTGTGGHEDSYCPAPRLLSVSPSRARLMSATVLEISIDIQT
ncbi:hypothetical protein M405DRAFT_935925 [Rhizopogon salebrosus TDB-379]|nr:hypothetical protein M405DRAFT_935925 [Rhizopogon salebrosus TDB-379]